jgi:hypothetical protein
LSDQHSISIVCSPSKKPVTIALITKCIPLNPTQLSGPHHPVIPHLPLPEPTPLKEPAPASADLRCHWPISQMPPHVPPLLHHKHTTKNDSKLLLLSSSLNSPLHFLMPCSPQKSYPLYCRNQESLVLNYKHEAQKTISLQPKLSTINFTLT